MEHQSWSLAFNLKMIWDSKLILLTNFFNFHIFFSNIQKIDTPTNKQWKLPEWQRVHVLTFVKNKYNQYTPNQCIFVNISKCSNDNNIASSYHNIPLKILHLFWVDFIYMYVCWRKKMTCLSIRYTSHDQISMYRYTISLNN